MQTMIYRLSADLVLIIHLAFVLWVVLGGLLVLRWPRLMWVHVPAVLWGAAIEFIGFVCPLTPLENYFATRAGRAGYEGSFIEHYLVPILYPDGLTPTLQLTLAGVVVLTNLVVYAWSPLRRHFTNKAASLARMGVGAEDDDPRP